MARPLSERNITVVESTKPKEEQRKKRKIRVAAYCRVSTDSKEQETSYDSQVLYYTELINNNPEWELVEIYADPAISGLSRKHRTEFNKMLYDCLHGKIDMIITKSMSRFARNKLDSMAVIRMLNGLKPPVGVLFEDDHVNSSDMSAEMIVMIYSMVAEQESVKKSSNIKWGFERRKEQGYYLVPTHNLLGYDKTQEINKDDREIIIVEDEATIVKVIFMMFLTGYKVSEIAYMLTEVGVKTAKGNTLWNSSSVLGILKNERYAGDIRTNKTHRPNLWDKKTVKNKGEVSYIYEKDHHTPIVSHEAFDMTQKLIASHKYGYDPFVNGTYSLTIIKEGLLKGFIPINVHWAGSDLKEYVELAKTVEQTSNLLTKGPKIPYFPGFQVVRRQELSHMSKASIRITPANIALNTKALDIIESNYVELLFNPIEKLICIRSSEAGMPGAVCWKRYNNDNKLISTPISCSAFCSIIYELMNWPKLWNTNLLAMIYEKNSEYIMLFDLSQPEINALPYEKPKPKKKVDETDALYNIEAMIAKQLELLHNRQSEAMYYEDNEEPQEELPQPKRKKLHPHEWSTSFGQDSADMAIGYRRYQFESMHEWNVSASGVIVDEFDHRVEISDESLQQEIDQMKADTENSRRNDNE